MTKKIYCQTCEKYVELSRKKFRHQYHELWFFFIFLTFGIGFIIYIIAKLLKKKNTCPYCESSFDLENLPKAPNEAYSR